MSNFNFEPCKAALRSFWQSWYLKIKNFLKELIRITVSFLWSALLAFCTATTIMNARDSHKPETLAIAWILTWVVLRIIRHLTVRNMHLFAGAVTTNSFQSAFVFILDGIISCFTLGRNLSEGGDILSPIILIEFGVLWIVWFLVDMLRALKRNYEQAMIAISGLENLAATLMDESVKGAIIHMQENDNPEKVRHWVPTEDEPERHKEN